MARYIEEDMLISLIKMGECNDYTEYCKGRNGGIAFAVERIKQQPTADVVKVVRCKDCDNWTDENGREGLCQVWSDFEDAHYRYTPKDGYCSEGERKENGKGNS